MRQRVNSFKKLIVDKQHARSKPNAALLKDYSHIPMDDVVLCQGACGVNDRRDLVVCGHRFN